MIKLTPEVYREIITHDQMNLLMTFLNGLKDDVDELGRQVFELIEITKEVQKLK